jgi:hypothetical protein
MKKLIVIGVILAGLVGIGLWAAGVYTSVRNEGRTQEIHLTAVYKKVEIKYGQWRLGVTDQLGIAREKRDAMDKILVDAVSGRYNKAGSPQVDNGKFFSAITEAYPDLKGQLDVYDKIVAYVAEGRKIFAQDQIELQEAIAAFNTWKNTGSLLHPMFAGWLFPDDNLEAYNGNKPPLKGQAALEAMSRPIVGSDTGQIFDEGQDKPIDTKEQK